MSAIRTVIVGAAGRMGQAIVRLLPERPEFVLVGAIDSGANPGLGSDVGRLAGAPDCGVALTSDPVPVLRGAELVIDFSSASAVGATLAAAVAQRVPMLIGTTGLDAATRAQCEAAARTIPLLVAANTSVGVTVLSDLVRRAAAALGPEFQIEVIEAHHARKLDAPSGTALVLGEAAAEGRGHRLEELRARDPGGRSGARSPAEIGFAVIRGGDVVGEHEILFLGPGERVALRHSATDRTLFARGALRAGAWLARQRPGRYSMADALDMPVRS